MKGIIKLSAKILELLSQGFILSLVKNKDERRKLHQQCDKIWYEIDRKRLYQILDRLKLQRLIESIKNADGIEKIKMTNAGKARILKYQLRNLKLQSKKKWDGKWRIVMFDVPEIKKRARDALRWKLKDFGFLEFQKSVFVYPYSCENEINFVINFFGVPECVYYIQAKIPSDNKLRKHFRV